MAAALKIEFDNTLNISVQKGDILFAVVLNNNQAGVNQPGSLSTNNIPVAVGEIYSVSPGSKTITVATTGYPSTTITRGHFLFFSKPKKINTSGLLGYYSLAEFRNSTKHKAEIFATGVEYAPSSK